MWLDLTYMHEEKRGRKMNSPLGCIHLEICLTNWPPKLSLLSSQQGKTEDCSIGFLWTWQAKPHRKADNGHTLLKLISRFWQAWLFTPVPPRELMSSKTEATYCFLQLDTKLLLHLSIGNCPIIKAVCTKILVQSSYHSRLRTPFLACLESRNTLCLLGG